MMRFLTYMGAPLLGACLLFPVAVSAQDAENPDGAVEEEVNPYPNAYGTDRVEARFIGLAGGIVVGSELVMAVQALAGVDRVWAYLTFPFVGAAAGGVGGFYLEKASPAGAVALLVVGIGLIIPTAIATASAFTYDPENEGAVGGNSEDGMRFSFEMPPSDTPKAETGKATTEVEVGPEGAPPAGALPPPVVPKSETAPPAASPGDDGGMAAPPEGEGGEAAPTGAAPPTKTGPTARMSKKRRSIEASRRRAQAGALIYVGGDGTAGLFVPALDVRPTRLASAFDLKRPRTGIQLFVPILHIDLP